MLNLQQKSHLGHNVCALLQSCLDYHVASLSENLQPQSHKSHKRGLLCIYSKTFEHEGKLRMSQNQSKLLKPQKRRRLH